MVSAKISLVIAVTAMLIASAHAETPALPRVIYDDITTQLFTQENSAAYCGTLPAFSVSSHRDLAWIVSYPYFCETDDPKRPEDTSHWNWGGTAGPVHDVYFNNKTQDWIKVFSAPAHSAFFVEADFTVITHHVSCDNGAELDCKTRYHWNGKQLSVIYTNYNNGPGKHSVQQRPRRSTARKANDTTELEEIAE